MLMQIPPDINGRFVSIGIAWLAGPRHTAT
jgi:hypothetical protein